MLRIASMNMMLHGVDDPNVIYQDTLSNSFPERYGELAENAFDVILANPPFKGSLDASDVHASLTGMVKTKKTELLFLALILRMLKSPGGRAATIVPDGVLFGKSKAHKAMREILVEKNQLDAVISLPSGVFRPYAGVSTAILVFTKGGQTDNVFFYDVQADGYSLDDKRDKVKDDDLPDMLERWRRRDPRKDNDRTSKAFFVGADEIRERTYDLSVTGYQEHSYEEAPHRPPTEIIAELKQLESQIAAELSGLEASLR
jgi:type I restriction enzyme M protein